MLVDLVSGSAASRADTANDDLPELLAMELEERPQRGVRRIGAAVSLAPHAVVPDEWQDYSPVVEQRAERLADRGAGLDGDRASLGVEVHALHRRDVDDRAHLGIRDESLEAVAAARHDHPAPCADGFVDGRNHLIGG